MIRGDNIICGTSSTGTTSPLVLTATPAPPGGVDFDVFARATGIGFGNSAAVLVSYTLIEYTDSTYATAKAMEKGVGLFTLGGSSGIANATLTRSTLQSTATNLNSPPATQNIAPVTALSIGTAANVLIFIGASSVDVPAYSPYVNLSGSLGDAAGAEPVCFAGMSATNIANNTYYYWNFLWIVPMLAKRATIYVNTTYSGGTPVSNAWIRLYDVSSTNGLPGKLLYDFGVVGSAGTSLNVANVVATGAAGNGFFMTPGDYWFCIAATLSGGSTTPQLNQFTSPICTGRVGTNTAATGDFAPTRAMTATGTPSSTPDDPAVTPNGTPTSGAVAFQLKAS